MNLLLINLSDVHIRSNNDAILSRGGQIAAALRSLDTTKTNTVVCLIAGDTVYSGTEDQFDIALDFYGDLKAKLEREFAPLRVEFVMVPGNHDCDFSDATAVRESILAAVTDKPSLLTESAHLNVCLEPLKRYFDFQDAIVDLPIARESQGNRQVAWEHSLNVGNSTARFLCFNTAILSTLRERPGQMLFPCSMIPTDRTDDAVVIAVYHHPSNWLEPNCARLFKKQIESISDIIITGHEHVIESRKSVSQFGDASYFECGALQENSDPNASEFSALLLNLDDKKRMQVVFRWYEDKYLPINGEHPDQLHLWQDFSQNSYRIRKSFRFQPDFGDWLNDTEVGLQHRMRGAVKLPDIYVYPDLRRVRRPGESGREVVKSNSVAELPLQHPSLFILGDDESGKTSMAKQFFAQLRSTGDVPVFVDMAKHRLQARSCTPDLEAAFARCYDTAALEPYRQLEKSRRAVIIDNYHKGGTEPKRRHELLAAILNHSFRVIIFAHEVAITLYDLSESTLEERPFAFYSILPFSISLQNRMIERWLMLSEDTNSDTSSFISNLERARSFMKTIFGKNYVSPYPPYLLAVLQASESGTDLDLKANTHGYFYELFIKNLIAKHSRSSLAVSILTAYLGHLAYTMYNAGSRQISIAEFRRLHNHLQEEFEVMPDFSAVMDELIAMQLLFRRNDHIRFKQSFIYYYFLATFLHQNIDRNPYSEVVKIAIQNLSNELYREESASTLLFLCHLSHDSRILEGLLVVCNSQFSASTPARLEADVQFVNSLQSSIGSVTLPDIPLSERRQHELEREEAERDAEIQYDEQNQAVLESGNTILGRLNAAIKTIQILGQFLKNFPGNLGKTDKDRIMIAVTGLGSRVLGECLGQISENQAQAVKEMVTLIARNRPGLSEDKLRDKAVHALVVLSEMAAFGIVTRVANSLGSNELSVTYDRYFAQRSGSLNDLTHLAIKLDHNEAFPESLLDRLCAEQTANPFVFRLIQFLVARRASIYPIDYDLKQKLGAKLQLKYSTLTTTPVDQRLLPST